MHFFSPDLYFSLKQVVMSVSSKSSLSVHNPFIMSLFYMRLDALNLELIINLEYPMVIIYN